MKARSLCVKLVMATALFLTAPWLYAQDGLEGALSRANVASPANLATPLRQTLAAADFDGDNKPDGAFLVDSGWLRAHGTFRIELHFTARNNAEISFESPGTAVTLAAWDVNHDGHVDIVVEQAFTHHRLHVWLNDGRGDFHEARSADFPSADLAAGQRLESPSPPPDCPAVCLGPQRGTEIATQTTRPLPGRPLSTGDFAALLTASSPASTAFSPDSPRAPPLSPSH